MLTELEKELIHKEYLLNRLIKNIGIKNKPNTYRIDFIAFISLQI